MTLIRLTPEKKKPMPTLEAKDRKAILATMRKARVEGKDEFIARAKKIDDVRAMMRLLGEFLDLIAVHEKDRRGSVGDQIAAWIYGLEGYFIKK